MEWISVKDKLPPELAFGQYETYLVALRSKKGGYVASASWLFSKFCTRHDGCSDVHPSHWMPLPDPPKEG